MIHSDSSIKSSATSDNKKDNNKKQQRPENESDENLKREEKENKDYWDRISEDPASGYGADRNEEEAAPEEP